MRRETQLSTTTQSVIEPKTTAQRIGWALLITVTLYICYFSNLDVIGFVGPDEPRYAWIARDMAESGDWVTPRLYGRPWFEKPPLLYWAGAIFFKIMPSQPEIAARLPSAISALFATLALAWLAWRTYGEECARWLLLLLPTSVGMIGFSHACATDMPFAGMLTVALVCAAVILGLVPPNDNTPILPRTPWLALVLFGFFMGLAILAKGPAALILTSGAVFFWALFTRRWRNAFHLLHPTAIATFCVTALPWYVLCARRNPDFFRIFIIGHNFKRYLTPEFQHVQPFWFYIPIVLIAFFPWTIAAITASILRRRTAPDLEHRPLKIFVMCWCAWTLLFFSLSQSKLPGYILPAMPAAVLLVVHLLFAEGSGLASLRRRFMLVTGLTLMLSAVALVVYQSRIPDGQDLMPAFWKAMVCLPLFIGGIVSLVYARKDRTTSSALWSAITVSLALLGLYVGLWTLDPLYSARFSTQATRSKYPSFEPEDAAVHQEPRGIEYGLNFYLRKQLPSWSSAPSAKWVFAGPMSVQQLEQMGFKCPRYIVFRGVFPCERTDSLGGLGSGRKPE